MEENLFTRYAPTIRDLEICDLDDKLLLDRDGPVSVYYAPFDYINRDAKIVIAGITPGKTQMLNALREVRKQLRYCDFPFSSTGATTTAPRTC
jgi:hypothetical protein